MTFIATFAFLLAGVAGVNPVMPVKQATAVGSYDNASIATIALTKVGQYGGQCKAFVNNMVSQASGGSQWPAPGYHGGFSAAGGVQVSSTNAEKGDIIQITPAGSTDATAESMYDFSQPSKRLHTAIIVENNGGGSFDVVDSNWGFNEVVMKHNDFNPYTWAAGSDIRIWRMGTVEEEAAAVRNAPRAVDFNGNGKDDILWYGPGADHDALWYGSSSRPAFNGESVTVGGADTYTPIEGDFDGDGHGDIFWYGPGSNTDRLWYGTGTAGEFDGEIITVSGMYIPVVGDFNGNGKDDILWYGPGADHDALWYGSSNRAAMFNTSVSITVGGADTYTPVSGDFDGDGYGDILWYGPGSNTDRLWYGSSTAGAFNGEIITVGGTYVPIVEDFNGNGKDDILWYGPGAGAGDALWYGSSNRPAFNGEDVEVTGRYKPVSGDFDGDGYGDILWYGPGDGTDRLWYGTSTASTFDKYVISVGGTYIPV